MCGAGAWCASALGMRSEAILRAPSVKLHLPPGREETPLDLRGGALDLLTKRKLDGSWVTM